VVIRTDKMSVDETVDIVVAMCGLELKVYREWADAAFRGAMR
jgi:hypothetical protein